MAWRGCFLLMARAFVANVGRDRSLVRYRLHLRDELLSMGRFLARDVTSVHGRKCEKGASLHRNRISMPGMATMGPVFRGAELRYEIDVASHQAKRIPRRGPLGFSWVIDPAEGPHCAIFCHDATVGRILRIVRRRATRAHRLPSVPRRVRVPTACPLLFASGLSALSLVVCDPSPPLMLACFSRRSLLCARATLLAVPLRAYAIPLSPYAESPLRPLRR